MRHTEFRGTSKWSMIVGAFCACVFGACAEPPVSPPAVRGSTLTESPYRSSAFVLDVSTTGRSVKVSPPTTGLGFASLSNSVLAHGASAGQRASLLGSDAVEMRISNYRAGAIGAVIPGKVHVTFDLSLLNRLNGVQLGTPSFPRLPTGVTGVAAFPFEASVLSSAGGVESRGNELLVTSPGFGAVIASDDWDGAPYSFFNDATCSAGSNDCFRYEPVGIIGAGVSTPRKVGFLVDPGVREFRIRIIVAADVYPVSR